MAATTRRIALSVIATIIIGAVIIGLSLCRSARPPEKEEAFPRGELLIGVDASYAPFAADNGTEVYGLDIDLARAIGTNLDVPVRFINIAYDGLYDALRSGQVDAIISALLINPAQMGNVRYTRPYFDNGLVLIGPPLAGFTVMDDLSGKRVALEYSSAAHSYAATWLRRIGSFQIHPYELASYALDSVRLQHSDAAIVDYTSYRLYAREHPDWAVSSTYLTSAPYAIAVRIDRDATRIWIEAALGRLDHNGTLQIIIDRWL